MEDLLSQVGGLLVQVVTNLTNPEAWKVALSSPGVTLAAFIVLNLIVFTETGLLVCRLTSTASSARSSKALISHGERPSIPSRWRCG